MTLTRIASVLPGDLEALVQKTIRCCIQVHRTLGPGMNERVYSLACGLELEAWRIAFERERTLPIRYRGKLLCHQRVDLFIEQRLVLEIKSVDAIHPVHIAQTVGYLRLTGARVGLVVNFNVDVLKAGIRRVVL